MGSCVENGGNSQGFRMETDEGGARVDNDEGR